MQYIGMDTHISNLDFAVVNDAGRLMKATSVATSVKNFMEFVRKVPPLRIIYMEEGTLAGWALEICAHFGEKLIITDPKENHWIGSSGQKNDPLDALKLAQLARGGYINAILLVGGILKPYGGSLSFTLVSALLECLRMKLPDLKALPRLAVC